MPSLKSPKSTLAQMALSSNQYALKVQRLVMIWAHNAAIKVPEWPSYGNFRQVTQTRIFWKSAKGGPRENFQTSPKKYPLFERPKSTVAQMALSSNKYALREQGLEKILAHKAPPKAPEWRSYGNFCKVIKKPHFLKECKRGTKKKFFKNRPKRCPP